MTELIQISQPPTEADGDANGQVFVVFRDGNKLLVEWNHSTTYGADHWARTDYNPPKRPTRIVYENPCDFALLAIGELFESNGRLYLRQPDPYWNGQEITTNVATHFEPGATVTPVKFE